METLLHDFRIESGSLRSEDNESYKMMKKIRWLRLIYYLTEIINYYFLLYILIFHIWDVSRKMKRKYKQMLNFHARTSFDVL